MAKADELIQDLGGSRSGRERRKNPKQPLRSDRRSKRNRRSGYDRRSGLGEKKDIERRDSLREKAENKQSTLCVSK